MRFQLIRRFAYVAGADKLSDEVMNSLGFDFVRVCCCLTRQAFLEHLQYTFPPLADAEKRVDVFTMFNQVSPLKLMRAVDLSDKEEWMAGSVECVVIPRHIQMAASHMGNFSTNIYSTWVANEGVANEGRTVEEEMAAAMDRYHHVPSLGVESFFEPVEDDEDDSFFLGCHIYEPVVGYESDNVDAVDDDTSLMSDGSLD